MRYIVLTFLLLGPLSAFSQNTCDSIEIVSLRYSPFTDSVVEVAILNYNTTPGFDYPGFILLNANGDTIAKEQVNLFVLGTQSVNVLEVQPGVSVPKTFEGKLELWTGFYNTLQCTWTDTFRLCPPACRDMIVSLSNWGGDTINASVDWTLLDSMAQVVGNGTFVLSDSIQGGLDTVCLEPGAYSLMLDTVTIQPGLPKISVTAGLFWSPTSIVKGYDPSDPTLDFIIHEVCLDGSTGIRSRTEERNDLTITGHSGIIQIRSEKKAIGMFRVFDMMGRMVQAGNSPDHHLTLDLRQLPTGVYLFYVEQDGSRKIQKIWKP